MKFNLQQFYKFCSQLKIETKEKGLVRMTDLLGTQTYVMDEIAKDWCALAEAGPKEKNNA
jgi:hypothetical protein